MSDNTTKVPSVRKVAYLWLFAFPEYSMNALGLQWVG